MSDPRISRAENFNSAQQFLYKFCINTNLVNMTISWLNMGMALSTNGHRYLQKVPMKYTFNIWNFRERKRNNMLYGKG